MIIDHIGLVVRCIDKGIKHWEDVFGYKQVTEIVLNTQQKVRVVFLEKDNSLQIKLLEPVDETSATFSLAKRGGGLHHICFICDDMDDELDRLKKKRLRVLVPPQPGEAFENENIAFLFAKQGLNIELIDTEKRANRIM